MLHLLLHCSATRQIDCNIMAVRSHEVQRASVECKRSVSRCNCLDFKEDQRSLALHRRGIVRRRNRNEAEATGIDRLRDAGPALFNLFVIREEAATRDCTHFHYIRVESYCQYCE